jgi:ribulose kinase
MREDAQLSGVNLGHLNILKVDGGMTVNTLLMNMQCNILNCEVQRPKIVETTALGAAYVAGLATGYFQSTNEVAKQWKLDKTFVPDEHAYSNERRSSEFTRWKRAIKRTLNWMHDVDPKEYDGDSGNTTESDSDPANDGLMGFVAGAAAAAGVFALLAMMWRKN